MTTRVEYLNKKYAQFGGAKPFLDIYALNETKDKRAHLLEQAYPMSYGNAIRVMLQHEADLKRNQEVTV